MSIVTLTTDFGLKDHYVAVIKGVLLSETLDLNLIDISHQIDNFNIVQAAFIFKNAWSAFPPGSIHLIIVNDLAEAENKYLLYHFNDQYFICPDNGILGLIFNSLKGKIYELTLKKGSTLSRKKSIAIIINKITRKVPLEEIGKPSKKLVERLTFQPVITANQIRGTIIYIDNYENAISNIPKSLFEKVGKKRKFELSFKRHPPLSKLCQQYSDVAIGAPLCLFNPGGYLEIAINMGKAASLLGLKLEEMIQVDFKK